jgi:type II secretory pathway pseudopilin PulG
MCGRLSAQRGFTYVGLLVAVVVMALMLTVVSRVWRTTEQRERETQLLFVGHAYRLAIASYFASGHRFPATLQELLQDDRFPVPKHHLRRLYPDPMTGNTDWSLVLTPSGQGIMGVASSSNAAPIKRDGFSRIDEAFKDTDCYCAWQFIYFPNRFMRRIGPTNISPNPPGSTGPAQTGQPGASLGSPTTLQPGAN